MALTDFQHEPIFVSPEIADTIKSCIGLIDFPQTWPHRQHASAQLMRLGKGAMSQRRVSSEIDAATAYEMLPALLKSIAKPVSPIQRQDVHVLMQWLVDIRFQWDEPIKYTIMAGDFWLRTEGDVGAFEQFIAEAKPPAPVTRPLTFKRELIGNPWVDEKRIELCVLLPFIQQGVIPRVLFDRILRPLLDGSGAQKEVQIAWDKFKIGQVIEHLQVIKSQSQIDAEAEPLLAQEHVTPPLDSPVGTPLESAAGGA